MTDTSNATTNNSGAATAENSPEALLAKVKRVADDVRDVRLMAMQSGYSEVCKKLGRVWGH
jgi:hypothetical protein